MKATENNKIKINVNNLSCSYGSLLAVNEVDLKIKANEITAFIGPSGCGKSTVLRALNRMNDTIPSSSVNGSVDIIFNLFLLINITILYQIFKSLINNYSK